MAAFAVALITTTCAIASEAAPATRPHVTGTDETIWVFAPRTMAGAKLPIIRTFFGDKQQPIVFSSPTLPDRYGELAAAAATGPITSGPDAARVILLYADGTTEQLGFQNSRGLPRWPGSELPSLWAGDALKPDVYAVGMGDVILLPTTRRAGDSIVPSERTEHKIASRPSTARSGDARTTSAPQARAALTKSSPPTTHPASGLVLLRLAAGDWQYVARLPEPAQHAARRWLSARDQRVHLFWRATPGGEIFCSTFWSGSWSRPKTLPDSEKIVEAWTSADRIGPVLVAAEAVKDGDGAAVRVYWRKDETWHASERLRADDAELRVDPAAIDATVARSRLVIVRQVADGDVEIGESALDGDRTVKWSPPIATGISGRVTPRPEWWAWVETIAIMFVLLVIFLSRQEMLAMPAPLPTHLEHAPPLRRIIANVIDLAPIAIATVPLWIAPLSDAALILPRLDSRLGEAVITERLAPPWYLVVLGNAAWCLLWEWRLGTTPGKHLMGCRVVNRTGARPTIQQIVVRNCVRVAELGILLVGVSSAFLLLAVSRNRQRIGDLLAETLVVRQVVPTARPVAATPEVERDDAGQA